VLPSQGLGWMNRRIYRHTASLDAIPSGRLLESRSRSSVRCPTESEKLGANVAKCYGQLA